MNKIADEMIIFLSTDEYIEHSGTPHEGSVPHSGRYAWGSGENRYQHANDIYTRIKKMQDDGVSDLEIAKALGYKTANDTRMALRAAKNDIRQYRTGRARALAEAGVGNTEIGRRLGGLSESTVRSLLNKTASENTDRATNTAEVLKRVIKEKGIIDIGQSVEREMGVSRDTLNEALFRLQTEGYVVSGVRLKQGSKTKHMTTVKFIAEPGDVKAIQREIYQDPDKIKSFQDYKTTDGGKRWDRREYPTSISSKRITVNYDEDGGTAKDGVIEIRPGVADLSLGNSHYAQVRILVDKTHYLKGMAMYADDLPEGVDIRFNTNKHVGTPLISKDGGKEVLKKISSDPDNPFGAYIKADGQSWYEDEKGERKLSAINKLREEGDWDKQSRNISSQFLSKQPVSLIKNQLNLTKKTYEDRYADILATENPTVRKKLLADFSAECDTAAWQMRAMAFPRQSTRVLLPAPMLRDNEIYAPYLPNGEKVVLIRYPHGGIFEIPELTVNNRNLRAKKIFGNLEDAVGITPKAAAQLSGADFDGDTAVVIPRSKLNITTKKPFAELQDFDPKSAYPQFEGMKVMSETYKQKQMGIVSNLITDMTLQGASDEELVRAVKHSMVVIDAAKHKLNYKQSYKDQGIRELVQKYQPHAHDDGAGGARTLISRRKQTVDVPERKGGGLIDPETGKMTYRESGRQYYSTKTGEYVKATEKAHLILETDDVNTLSSGTRQETLYADFSNSMKALARKARMEQVSTPNMTYSSEANKKYSALVAELDAAIDKAARNEPKERRALAIKNGVVNAKIRDNPELKLKENADVLRKIERCAMDDARLAVGASGKESRIRLTNEQWEAIQAGAISSTKLTKIIRYADEERLRELAQPKSDRTITTQKQARIKALEANGYTIAEIAEQLGISSSTVSKYLS